MFNSLNLFPESSPFTLLENRRPQEMILSFNPIQGKYIKTHPCTIHRKCLLKNKKEVQIKAYTMQHSTT
jgi:hypothetical protein